MLGLRSVGYHVKDLAGAKAWYTKVLRARPYFDQPFYVGFDVGGFELGLLPPEKGQPLGPGGQIAYWGVTKAAAAWKRPVKLGAKPFHKVTDVGGGIKVGAVKDPFGNILGVIENPHFKVKAPRSRG